MPSPAFHRVALAAVLAFGFAGHASAQHGSNFGRPAPAFSYPAPQYQSPNYQQPWAAQSFADPGLKITVTPHAGHAAGARSLRSGSQMVCVRTCDGFFFPVSAGSGADRTVAEFMCKASCPGAPVKVFTKRGDDIENAVGTDRSLYRRLAGALSFRTASSPTCSCRRPTGAITSGPVFDDPTLKAGDVIVVRGRARLQGRVAALHRARFRIIGAIVVADGSAPEDCLAADLSRVRPGEPHAQTGGAHGGGCTAGTRHCGAASRGAAVPAGA
jgi:hypothetical protein